MSFAPILAVAVGGAIGALARYGLSAAAFSLAGPGFPWGTLVANLVGCLLMGVLIGVFARFSVDPWVNRLLITGALGALTTFSTFALDAVALHDRGQSLLAAVYVAVSVVAGLAALLLGRALIRLVSGGTA